MVVLHVVRVVQRVHQVHIRLHADRLLVLLMLQLVMVGVLVLVDQRVGGRVEATFVILACHGGSLLNGVRAVRMLLWLVIHADLEVRVRGVSRLVALPSELLLFGLEQHLMVITAKQEAAGLLAGLRQFLTGRVS